MHGTKNTGVNDCTVSSFFSDLTGQPRVKLHSFGPFCKGPFLEPVLNGFSREHGPKTFSREHGPKTFSREHGPKTGPLNNKSTAFKTNVQRALTKAFQKDRAPQTSLLKRIGVPLKRP